MKKWLVVLLLILGLSASGQEFELVRHQVQMGETVKMIAVKYRVPPNEIYKLNKFAVDGIQQGQVLQIMVPKKEAPAPESAEAPAVQHTETTQETSVAGSDGTNTSTTTTTTTTTTVRRKKKQPAETPAEAETQTAPTLGEQGSARTHTVVSGETLFGIARQYNIPVDDLKSQNAGVLKRGLKPGQVLTIIGNASPAPEPAQPAPEPQAATETAPAAPSQTLTHTVSKGETLFSLAQQFHTTVDAIKEQNPDVQRKGLQVGQVLTITSNP